MIDSDVFESRQEAAAGGPRIGRRARAQAARLAELTELGLALRGASLAGRSKRTWKECVRAGLCAANRAADEASVG